MRRIPRGFTLVEIAIAIFIITILLGSILVPLTTQVENRNYDNTQRMLDQAREALLGYAAAYGYFPCPASASSNGAQATGAGYPGSGTCHALVTFANAYIGFLPAATLGFTPVDSNGYAVDAWGLTQNRIRYAVSSTTVNAITNPFTKTNGIKNAGMANITNTALLYVCSSGNGVVAGTNCGAQPPAGANAVLLTSNAIAVIWSVGPNAATGGSSVHEAQNPNPNGGSADRIFVSRTRATAGAAGGEFDDIVTWLGPATIFNRLIAAGQLP
ncbi:MAG: type II secretion system protein [Burkholderiales bacterium]